MKRTKTRNQTTFEALDRLWARDAEPWRVEEHYFLYWFAVHQGKPDQAAEELSVHRNTVEFHFKRFGFDAKADQIRQNWGVLAGYHAKISFEVKFFKLYQMTVSPNPLAENENKALIRLWQSGFPFKTIDAHYMLWALRRGKSKIWIQKEMGYSSQHCMRVLTSLLDPQSDNGRWLAPLNPRQDEIYTRGPRDRLLKARLPERSMAVSE